MEIIISRGYHAEMHPVTTDDGYILMLHRIPYPKARNSGPTGQPVFILHGIPDSSADWVLLPTEKSLGTTIRRIIFALLILIHTFVQPFH